METIILNHIDLDQDDRLIKAARVLKDNGTVVFPTETVYGLGANALDEKAIEKIYKAKGRPSDNPLIVHVASQEQVDDLVEEVPLRAKQIMEAFWPGPLTIILKKNPDISDVVTGGLDTIAIRMPSNKIALKIIEQSGLPIAAPSANISGRPSPTQEEHVIKDLDGRVDMIVCGGKTVFGLESTVLDLTTSPALILRPGSITLDDIKRVINDVTMDPGLNEKMKDHVKPRSPGMKYTHYSPDAEVILFEGKERAISEAIKDQLIHLPNHLKIGILATEEMAIEYLKEADNIITLGKRSEPGDIGAMLFKALRDFDELGVDIILAEGIEAVGVGEAVMNRLRKAASNIIRV